VGGLIMIKDFTKLICKSIGHPIRIMTGEAIIFQGIQEDFDAAGMTLRHNSYLKEFKITNCQPAIKTMPLDALVLPTRTMATMGSIPSSTMKTPVAA